MNAPAQDSFVSLCLPAWDLRRPGGHAGFAALASALAARYRYWEILIGCDADDEAALDEVLAAHPNARVVLFQPLTPHYERRLAVAGDAIGDVVVVSAQDEAGGLDLAALIEQARAEQAVVLNRLPGGGPLDALVGLLGRSAGFRVHGRSLQTVALPRTQLNRILAHVDGPLALRFPPADPALRLVINPVQGKQAAGSGRFRQRLALIQRLIVSTAPRVLTLVAAASVLGAVAALLSALYAVFVVLTFDHVQPGWFTTAILISVPAFFISLANFGLAIGLIRVLELVGRKSSDLIVGERGGTDLFARALDDLNLEVSGPAAADGHP